MPKHNKKQPTAPDVTMTFFVDGECLLSMVTDPSKAHTKKHFTTAIRIKPGARHGAIALTLIETARFLVQDHDDLKELLMDAEARLTLYDTDMGSWADAVARRDPDLPF